MDAKQARKLSHYNHLNLDFIYAAIKEADRMGKFKVEIHLSDILGKEHRIRDYFKSKGYEVLFHFNRTGSQRNGYMLIEWKGELEHDDC